MTGIAGLTQKYHRYTATTTTCSILILHTSQLWEACSASCKFSQIFQKLLQGGATYLQQSKKPRCNISFHIGGDKKVYDCSRIWFRALAYVMLLQLARHFLKSPPQGATKLLQLTQQLSLTLYVICVSSILAHNWCKLQRHNSCMWYVLIRRISSEMRAEFKLVIIRLQSCFLDDDKGTVFLDTRFHEYIECRSYGV